MSTILLVEDNPADARLATLLLERTGHSVVCVGDAESGLAVTRDYRPDLVLLDLDLPGISGLEALRHFKGDPDIAAIPVVICTAYLATDPRLAVLSAGAADFIAKPYHYMNFMATVNAALDGA